MCVRAVCGATPNRVFDLCVSKKEQKDNAWVCVRSSLNMKTTPMMCKYAREGREKEHGRRVFLGGAGRH